MTLSKRKLKLLLPLLALVLLLAACAPAPTTAAPETTPAPTTTAPAATTTEPAERLAVRIAALKGPTGIGLVGLMAGQEQGSTANDYTFSLAGSPDDIVAQLSSGQADIAALPTNLAAALYQKMNKQVRMLAINTLGVLYILEKGDTVHTLNDLSGKTILATGQGAVPEYVLNELLAKADLATSATVEYKGEHSELAALAAAGEADLVMLPEPFVTTVLAKNPDFRLALDLTEEWRKVQAAAGSESELSMGCLVVTAAFAEAHPEALSSFLNEYLDSVDFVNGDPEAAGAEVARFEIMPDAALAARAIPNCHIVLIEGEAMKATLDPFFSVLFAANPQSVGGQLPDADFYWSR